MDPGLETLLATVTIGLSLGLAAAGAAQLRAARRRRLERHGLQRWQPRGAASRRPAAAEPRPLLRLVEWAARLPAPDRASRALAGDLGAAGLGSPAAASRFRGTQMLGALLAAAAGVGIGLGQRSPSLFGAALYGLTGLVMGYYLPRLWLDARRRRRLAAIELSLPDVIDLLVVCIEAGMGLNAALVRVATEMEESAPELCAELGRLNQEIRAGVARIEALRALARRAPVQDVESVVGVLIQSERMGTSVGQPLRTQAHLLRTRRRQRAEGRARRATVQLIFPLVFCIFPVILVVLLGPALYGLLGALGTMGP